MLTFILTFIKKLWISWASLFSFVPYGDPYVAFVALFMVFCIGIWALQKIHVRVRTRRSSRFDSSFNTQEDRLKTYCKVMNIR